MALVFLCQSVVCAEDKDCLSSNSFFKLYQAKGKTVEEALIISSRLEKLHDAIIGNHFLNKKDIQKADPNYSEVDSRFSYEVKDEGSRNVYTMQANLFNDAYGDTQVVVFYPQNSVPLDLLESKYGLRRGTEDEKFAERGFWIGHVNPKVTKENGETWFDQGWFIGYIKAQILTLTEGEELPNYNEWMGNSSEIETLLHSKNKSFIPSKLSIHSKSQAKHSEQALVELVSNGLDAIDAWISRFGLGFYQALGELENSDDRVYFAGETESGKRIGLTFRVNEYGCLQVRPMTTEEVERTLAERHGTTVVRVNKSGFDESKKESYKRYLKERIKASRRIKVTIDDELANPLIDYTSAKDGEITGYYNEGELKVKMHDDGYEVANSGKIEAKMLFEKLIIPRNGRDSGKDRAKDDKTYPEPDIVFKKSDTCTIKHKMLLTVQVSEMGVETFEIEGIGLPSELIIKLPPEIGLNASRDQVAIDEKYELVMKEIINRLSKIDNIESLVLLANGLYEYLQKIATRSEAHKIAAKLLTEILNKTVRDAVRDRLKTEGNVLILPALEYFHSMELGDGESKRVYLHPDLCELDVLNINGLETVKDFRSNESMVMYYVEYKQGTEHPPIFKTGKMIFLDKKIYDWANGHPLRMALINQWLTFQVGYGPMRAELGWWGEEQETVSKKQEIMSNEEEEPEDENSFQGIDSGHSVWKLFEALKQFQSRDGVSVEKKRWTDFARTVWPFGTVPVGRAVWSRELPIKSSDFLQAKNTLLPDGRRVLISKHPVGGGPGYTAVNVSLHIETTPKSGVFVCHELISTELILAENDIQIYPVGNGRILVKICGKLFAQKKGTSDFILINNNFRGYINPNQALPFFTDNNGRLCILDMSGKRNILRETDAGNLSFEILTVPVIPDGYELRDVSILPDGNIRYIVAPSDGKKYQIYSFDTNTGECKRILETTSGIVSILPNGRLCYGEYSEEGLFVETYLGSNEFNRLDLPSGSNTILGFLPDNRLIVGNQYNHVFFVVNAECNRVKALSFQNIEDLGTSVSFTCDQSGRIVAIVSNYSSSIDGIFCEEQPNGGIMKMTNLPKTQRTSLEFDSNESVFLSENGRVVLVERHYGYTIEDQAQIFHHIESGEQYMPVPCGNMVFNNGVWFEVKDSSNARMYQIEESIVPPTFTRDERTKIGYFAQVNEHTLKMPTYSENLHRYLRNLARLGSFAVKRIELSPFLTETAMRRIDESTYNDFEKYLEGKSFLEKNTVCELINFIASFNISDELLNQYIQRWLVLYQIDYSTACSFSKFILEESGFMFLVSEGVELSEAPLPYRAVLQFFQSKEAKILPDGRPNAEEDIFGNSTSAVLSMQGEKDLALLLATQLKKRDALKSGEGNPLLLDRILSVMRDTEGEGIETRSQKDAIIRTVRSQADGYAIWIRELVQNARDAMRKARQTDKPLVISAWFEGNDRITRVTDPVGMSLSKIIHTYFPIDVSDKGTGLTGKIGQGNYSIWLDADTVRIRTGKGNGKSYAIEMKAERDQAGDLTNIKIVRFEEYNDGFCGTSIEHVKTYNGSNSMRKSAEAALLRHSISRYIGDVRDVEIRFNTFNQESVNEGVCSLSGVEDKEIKGSFEIYWTKGAERVTCDGLEVHTLTEKDWEGVPSIIRKQLESNDKILMRYPKGTPLTEPRNEPSLREVDPIRWSRLRFAAIALASVEVLQQHGIWIPDMPQDVLNKAGFYSDSQTIQDAEKINQGNWHEVDFTRYEKGEEFIKLIICIKGKTSGISLYEAYGEINKLSFENVDQAKDSTNGIESLKSKLIGLGCRIDYAYNARRHELSKTRRLSAVRESIEEERNIENKNLSEAGYSESQKLFDLFTKTLEELGDTLRQSRMTSATHFSAQVSGVEPLVIRFAEQYAVLIEAAVKGIQNGKMTEQDVREFLRRFDVFIHEYAHTEEFTEFGVSSHLTHQSEGELPNSFPIRMQKIIERLISAQMDLEKLLPNEEKSQKTTTKPAKRTGLHGFVNRIIDALRSV